MPRTRLSASALYARSISFEKSRTILRPSDCEPFTVHEVVASIAPPSARAMALICPWSVANASLYFVESLKGVAVLIDANLLKDRRLLGDDDPLAQLG